MLPDRAGVVAIPTAIFYDHPEAARSHVRFAFCKRPEVLTEALNAPFPAGRRWGPRPTTAGGAQAHGGRLAGRPPWDMAAFPARPADARGAADVPVALIVVGSVCGAFALAVIHADG